MAQHNHMCSTHFHLSTAQKHSLLRALQSPACSVCLELLSQTYAWPTPSRSSSLYSGRSTRTILFKIPPPAFLVSLILLCFPHKTHHLFTFLYVFIMLIYCFNPKLHWGRDLCVYYSYMCSRCLVLCLV